MTAKTREWSNYIKSNRPESSDCRLVSAVNSYYYLTGKVIKQMSDKYTELQLKCKAIYGPALKIENVWDKLKIEPWKTMWSFPPTKNFRRYFPAEAVIYHKAYGCHSVLIIDYEPITNSLRVTNFDRETNLKGWIYSEDFNHFSQTNFDKTKKPYKFRSFRLKNQNLENNFLYIFLLIGIKIKSGS